jgi:hypothetical protein
LRSPICIMLRDIDISLIEETAKVTSDAPCDGITL